MADPRASDQIESRAKRVKLSSSTTSNNHNMDPKNNPYLAHMYQDSAYHHKKSSNGFPKDNMNGSGHGSSLAKLPRHNTTSAMAMKLEDGPDNPFTGQPLSQQYLAILKTRRDLPVHAQRYEGVVHCFASVRC